MFQKIIAWIKELWSKMFNQNDIKRTVGMDAVVSTEMSTALETWTNMYTNNADWLSDDILSAGISAAIASEIARAVTIEMQVKIDGAGRGAYLQEQMSKVLPKMRIETEYGCAKGGLMFKPYVKDKVLEVDYVQADMFYPLAFDGNGNITSCIFVDQRTAGKDYFTRFEIHEMGTFEDETGAKVYGCRITNKAFKSNTQATIGQEVSLEEYSGWATLPSVPKIIKNIAKPLFGYFKFPSANIIDPSSPLGISCYARAVDQIKQADKIWSNLIWEFESGKRAIYVDAIAFEKDATTGKPKLPDRRLYRTLENPTAEVGSNSKLFEAWSPEFREASIKSGLDAVLKRIEFNCGLAYGTISDPSTVAKTATELKISQQRSYSTITDTQKALQFALEGMIYAMDVWATLYKLAPIGKFTTSFDFDDSVIVDKDVQFQQDMRLVNNKLMGRVEFRMRNMGEDEATAKKHIAEIDAETPDEQDMFPNDKKTPAVKGKENGKPE